MRILEQGASTTECKGNIGVSRSVRQLWQLESTPILSDCSEAMQEYEKEKKLRKKT